VGIFTLRAGQPQPLSNCCRNLFAVADPAERNEEYTPGMQPRLFAGCLQRQPGFPNPTRSQQRDQAAVRLCQQVGQFIQFILSPGKRRQSSRQVVLTSGVAWFRRPVLPCPLPDSLKQCLGFRRRFQSQLVFQISPAGCILRLCRAPLSFECQQPHHLTVGGLIPGCQFKQSGSHLPRL